MKKTQYALQFLMIHALFLFTFAQSPVSYNDVLVVVNSNSSISVNVGNYFKAQRGIPNQNMCALSMPITEEIDSLQFRTISNQIKSYMSTNGLTASINYIVTTQGVPLKVRRSGSVMDLWANSSSFDGDLSLLNSMLESSIGNAGRVINPYRNATARFSRSAGFSNMYLVTRLAGYSYNDIVGLIDRARQPYHSSGKFVFDVDPGRGLTTTYNILMGIARDTLLARGLSVTYDETYTYLTHLNDVLGYVSWGSNDCSAWAYSWKAQPQFTWSPKALAETYVSTSGRTFSDSTFIEPSTGWQSLVADLIHENGVTGVKGYVFEPFASALAKPDLLFARWTSGFNLAESYYIASNYIGWMDVIVGDPKSLFAAEGHLPVQLVSFSGVYANNSIKLHWKTVTETNNFGFEIQRKSGDNWQALGFVAGSGTVNTPRTYSFCDENPAVRNIYRLKQIDRDGSVEYSGIMEVQSKLTKDFVLQSNYPNPVVSTTSIPFSILEASNVSAEILDMEGKVITRLLIGDMRLAGQHYLIWDRLDSDRNRVPSGKYLCKVTVLKKGATSDTKVSQITVL